MTEIELGAVWVFDGPLHVGTGLSQSGLADRMVRLDADRRPYIPGDAVKGAVRGAAERIVRWLIEGVRAESEDHSLPQHPALRRLFLPPADGFPLYRFYPASYLWGGEAVTKSRTSIDPETGVAKDETLRTIQTWGPGSRFGVRIRGFRGSWDNLESTDRQDLVLLLAALVSADGIGGEKGVGHGACRLEQVTTQLVLADLVSPIAMEDLQRSLGEEV